MRDKPLHVFEDVRKALPFVEGDGSEVEGGAKKKKQKQKKQKQDRGK